MTESEALCSYLRVSAAPLVMERIETTAEFFHSSLNLNPLDFVEYLRGIDFHREVAVRTMTRGTELIQYHRLDSPIVDAITPFAFFTMRGVSPFQLGWSRAEWELREYNVLADTPALVSIASSLSYGPRNELPAKGRSRDSVSRIGGGVQYIISRGGPLKLLRVGSPTRL